jgi:hypothetical protein
MFDVFYYGPKPNLFEFEKPATSLEDANQQARTRYYWYIYGGNDYTNFNFDFVPAPWEADFTHVWPSQWQKNSGTILAPKDVQEHKWHWLEDPVVPRTHIAPIYYMDMYNAESTLGYQDLLERYGFDVKRTRYVDSHLNVFKRIIAQATTEYVWIVSSVCDYTNFDFTWHPGQWQEQMIHCFPSGTEKRGDTFLLHVESFKQQMVELELLDWFNVINYCEDQHVVRYQIPVHVYESDNLVKEILNYDFTGPYAMFTNQPDMRFIASPCLWTEKDRTVERCSISGATCIVPRDIKTHLRTQIYDYPHLSTSVYQVNEYYRNKDFPGLDIVYISNGEPDEQKWYEHTCYQTNSDVKWVRGINGRVAAYQEAARQSTTPWFFAVFAKLEVVGGNFPWYDWMPDYWQEPKHYIFNARNPVNGLEYGHMGVIAYNKNLVLANNNPGIDFTLSQPHESVPILSAIAHYNQDPWTTWRTAFREVLKLRLFMDQQPTLETEYRLKAWFKHTDAKFGEWSVRGAQDAQDYYDLVSGNYNDLMKSFEWDWLRNHFNRLHNIQQ